MGYASSCCRVVLLGLMFAISLPVAGHANVWVRKDEVSAKAPPPQPMLEVFDPNAPDIVVESPSDINTALKAPVKVLIKFVPKNGARILVDTVKLIYVTFFSNIDITDRVRDRITEQGIQDDAADLPSGSHHLIVKVSDDHGLERSKEFRFDVE